MITNDKDSPMEYRGEVREGILALMPDDIRALAYGLEEASQNFAYKWLKHQFLTELVEIGKALASADIANVDNISTLKARAYHANAMQTFFESRLMEIIAPYAKKYQDQALSKKTLEKSNIITDL